MAAFILPYGLAFILGLLSAIALPPLNSLPLTLGALTAFFYIFLKMQPKRVALYCYLFFVGYFIIGLYWIGNALLVEGNEYRWAWPLAVLGLPLGLGLFYALAGWYSRKISTNAGPLLKTLILAHAIIGAEFIRSYIFTGFPWNLLGTTWSNYLPLMQSANIWGLLGLTWLMVLISALTGYALYETRRKLRFTSLGFAIALITLNYGYGLYNLNQKTERLSEKAIHVVAIQPNISKHEKWDLFLFQKNLDKLINTTLEGIAQAQTENTPLYIIWPETALSYHFTENKNFIKQIIARFIEAAGTEDITFITGALTREFDAAADQMSYRNATLYFNANGDIIADYAKSHLVPFGEYIPFQQYIPLKTVTGFTGFEKGQGPEYITAGSLQLLNKICYEIIFPSEFIPPRKEPENTAHAIIHITNDAWYGASTGPYQHLNLAKYRAIENNTQIFRSANKGFSAIISSNGYTLDESNMRTQSFAYTNFYPYKTKSSVYILVGIWLTPLLLGLLNTILLVIGLRKRI